MKVLPIGTKVRRLASPSDYTNGRTGNVIDIDEEEKRYRVQWFNEASGRPIRPNFNGQPRGLKTWVKFEAAIAVD